MKIHFISFDSRQNDSDFSETCGSFDQICNTLKPALRELGVYTDNFQEATHVGYADSLNLGLQIPQKQVFTINFQDTINTIPTITLQRKANNLNLKLIALNKHTAGLWNKYGFDCGVIGAALDENYWQHVPVGGGGETFNFTFANFSNFRSGLDLLLQAWDIAFSGNKDVKLIIKNTSDSEILTRRIESYKNKGSNIEYISGRWTYSQLRNLYLQTHVSLNVYRMSGHGLIIGEAGACGGFNLVGGFQPSEGLANEDCASLLHPSGEVYIDEIMSDLVNNWGLTNTFGGLDFPERPRVYTYSVEEYSELLKVTYENWDHFGKLPIRDSILKIWNARKSAKKLIDYLEKN